MNPGETIYECTHTEPRANLVRITYFMLTSVLCVRGNDKSDSLLCGGSVIIACVCVGMIDAHLK